LPIAANEMPRGRPSSGIGGGGCALALGDLLEERVDDVDVHVARDRGGGQRRGPLLVDPGGGVGGRQERLERALVDRLVDRVDVDVGGEEVDRDPVAARGRRGVLGGHDQLAGKAVLGDRVIRPERAVVGHEQVEVLAEAEVAVEAGVGEQRVAVEGEGAVAGLAVERDGLVLEEGLLGVAASLGVALDPHPVGVVDRVLPAVVDELVVVPDDDEGELLVHPLQDRVGPVGLPQLAVVRQRPGRVVDAVTGAELLGAGLVGEGDVTPRARLELRVSSGLVDVVAEVDDEVDVVVGLVEQLDQRVVVAPDVVLAGQHGEADRRVHVGLCRGLEAPDRRGLVAAPEAVVVAGRALQLGDLDPDAVVGVGGGGELALRQLDQAGELGVGAHLEGHGHVAAGGDRRARPQDDRGRARVTRDDRLGKAAHLEGHGHVAAGGDCRARPQDDRGRARVTRDDRLGEADRRAGVRTAAVGRAAAHVVAAAAQQRQRLDRPGADDDRLQEIATAGASAHDASSLSERLDGWPGRPPRRIWHTRARS